MKTADEYEQIRRGEFDPRDTPAKLAVGDPVKRYDVHRGWMFGRVTGMTFSHRTGLWEAMVRWIRDETPTTHTQFCLEKYDGEPGSFRMGQQVQNIECHWQGRVTGFEWIDGIEMLICHHVCGGRIEEDDKRWFDPRDMRLVETSP